jgi:hypothetical protein
VQERAIADGIAHQREARKVRDIRGDIRQILCGGQMMPIREVLHPLIPTLIVAEVDELLQKH